MSKKSTTIARQRKVWSPDKCIEILGEALGSYEKNHPHWRMEVLISLVSGSLRSLKHYIEEKRDPEITWESPFVELHYPVEWDWKIPCGRDITRSKLISGKITTCNTSDTNGVRKTLTQIMVRHLNAMALQDLTNHAWLEKRHNYYTPYLPVEITAQLRAIKNNGERRRAFDQLFRPFSIGAASIDYGDMKFRDGARVPKKVAEQLSNIGNPIDAKRIGLSGDVNGRKFEMSLIFQIHPLIADYDKKKAYQPITIGLFIEPQIRGKDVIAPNPAEWPAKDREEFWAALLREMEKLADKFIPPNESQTSEILLLNAELEVPLASSHPEERKKAIKQIFEALSAAGQVLHMDMRPAVKPGAQALGSHENLRLLLRQRDRATTATEKGKALEELVSALFGTIRGFEVKERRVVTATEEIDLLILNDSDDPRLKREEAYILVECKNWSTKCGKNEFVAFQEKIRNRKGRSSVGVLVSWNGFAETITKEMLRSSHEKLLIVPIDGGQIRLAVEQGTFYQVLVSALDKATHL